MAQDNPVSRRTALKLTGAAASTALVAGCSGGGNGNGNGNGNGGGSDGVEIESGTEVDFSGQTTHWEGLSPSSIEGAQNPTLILQEGEEYTFGWSEGDGANHNLEIRNSNGEIVNDLTTGDPVAEPGDDQVLTFEASSEMATYNCDPHPQMEGEIVVE
ncbi:twin-arginine translocation signal domain-containing protein [Natrinema limicola]|uniref:Blue (Type 1) copper domain-containing protein n=1 Tax=Natrinema limicola JCM 13563 TaxID=1230457 RepID=M0C9D8_9EURY|nr:twin-arginine translocation signal domain-containing protein [Natrinema limicola]ELZ19248.1 blue (type 1) copper domain-containing protein [Natrinema limicola JCM 13563]